MEPKSTRLNKCIYFILFVALLSCGSQTIGQSLERFQNVIENEAIGIDYPASSERGAEKLLTAMQLGNFRVLAIGEQSHGTSEFFQLRTNLIKGLASKNLVTKIGLEAPVAEVDELNKIVQGKGGDLRQTLKSFRLYSYECSEFVELVEAVKSINHQRDKKIAFFGFDVQSPFQVLDNMLGSLPERDKSTADSLKKLIDNYRLLNDQVYSHNFSEQDFNEQYSLSQYILARYEQFNITGIKKAILDKEVTSYRQFLLLNNPRYNWDDNAMSLIRDSVMAVNVYNELAPDDKIAILAHNAHIQKTPNPFSKSMGLFLYKKLGADYKTLALTTSSGFYTTFSDSVGKITNSNEVVGGDKDTFEYYFGQLEYVQ